jgi:hypothetical protein
VGKAEPRDRRVAVPEPVAAAAADCLAANAQCLALLHEATGIGNCRYDYDYRQMFPHFLPVRSCVRLLTLATVSHAGKGDAVAAAASIQDALSLGDSLAKEPFLMSHMVQLACETLTLRGLEWALNATAFTDSQLKDLSHALVAAGEKVDLAETFISERCYMIESVRDPSLTGLKKLEIVILGLPGVRSRGLIDLVDYMGDSIEAARLPRPRQIARFREVGTRLDNLSVLHVVAKVFAPALVRIAELDLRFRAHLDLARTALAIERHRLATGKVPAQLADLIPTYLEQVPIDPFDGQPIRYRRTEPGYVLYSIMEDGKDNGGKEREDVGKNQPYDLCFVMTR